MRKAVSLFAGTLATVLVAMSASAQTTQTGTGGGGSPHVKSESMIGGAHIVLEYGRPSLKGRAEATMMPLGKPWRTGADAATVLTTDKPMTFGAITLAPGSYTINTQPGEKEWQLLVGKLGKGGAVGGSVCHVARDWPHADEARQNQRARGAGDVLNRHDVHRRHAAHRVGDAERQRSVHGGEVGASVQREGRRSADRRRFDLLVPARCDARYGFTRFVVTSSDTAAPSLRGSEAPIFTPLEKFRCTAWPDPIRVDE